MLAEPSLLVDKHCVTKISRPGVGGKGPYFASAIGMAHLSRDYPPPFHDPAATSQGWGPHYEGQWVVHETKTVDSDPDEAVASEEGSPAKEKGAKGDKGGGQPKFSWQLIMDKKINMRRFNVRIKQMGPHSDVHSGGIRIGVVAAKPTVPTFASPALDRCWRSALFDNRIWYVDGSIGEDHNKSPMGGVNPKPNTLNPKP
ncbi:hypothetical protein T484DRAFT_2941127 [Baffinella frigidus]|nr:hypothetical protein T484DRAFT_2941127 [Cryptophyta sp. CCMP2293]